MANEGQRYISTEGISTAIIEATQYSESLLERQGIYVENERMMLDRVWLKKVLQKQPGIRYIRIVKTKPEGGIFAKRRFYFDAFLARKMKPGTDVKCWMLYLVILSKKQRR